jgi:D-alanyl-D-alanine endopeptidase (penicillin-binding protein 7)
VPHFASRCVSSVSLRVGLMVLFLASVSLLQPTLANAQARQSADSAAKHVKGPAPGSVAQRPGAQRPGAQRANPPPAQKASGTPAPSRQRAASTAVRPAGSQHTQSAQRAAPPGARAARVSPQMAEARRGTDMRSNRPARALPAVAATTAAAAVAVPTIGRAIGLHQVADPLSLRSSVALVMDQQTGQVVYQKNPQAVLPIASITKLMTAMVVIDSGASLSESLLVTEADRDTERHSSSRLPIGSQVSRADMLLLALMSSENRAAHALGRLHPEGLSAFVAAMNAKARALGLADTRFSEPTGLSGGNVSSARDLARLTAAAHAYPLIREYSTANGRMVDVGRRQIGYRSTNRLVDHPSWEIGLQKTGFISEAGKCLVMQATVDGRDVIIVLLDAQGSQSRFADAERLRRWLSESAVPGPTTTQGPSASGPEAGGIQRAWPS